MQLAHELVLIRDANIARGDFAYYTTLLSPQVFLK